jgi:integrase
MNNERRPKGLGTIEKVHNGFRARRTIHGQRVCGTVRKTRLEAERDLRNLIPRVHKRSEVPTFADYVEDLLKTRFMKRHRQTTWECNETVLRLYIRGSRLGRMKLDAIKRRDIQDLIDSIQHSAHYVRRIGAFISVVLTEAVTDEYISSNPAFRVRYPEVEERTNRTLSPEEAIKLLNPTDRLTGMILIAAHTGLRRGEVCGLKWEDVKEDLIKVRRAIAPVRGGDIETKVKTKTSMSEVPLTPEAMEVIRRQPRRSAYVFTADNGKPVSPSNLTRDFSKWAKKNGLAGMRFHDLRGSYVSLLIEQGVDVRTVQELARHADPRTTLSAYARARKAVKTEAVAKLRDAIVPNIGHKSIDIQADKAQAV